MICVTDPPYNAVGDGVTDDTAAFAAAAAALSEGERFVWPDARKYVVGGFDILRPGVVIEGWGATLLKKPGAARSLIGYGDGLAYMPEIRILGATFEGQKDAGGLGDGLDFFGCERPQLVGVKAARFHNDGVVFRGLGGEGQQRTTYPVLDDCYITTCGRHGVAALQNAYAAQITGGTIVSGCGARDEGGAGFYAFLNDSHNLDGGQFDENRFGVYAYACSSILIGGVTFLNTRRTAILLFGGGTYHRVIGNDIQNPSTEAADTYAAIAFDGQGHLVEGNGIWGRRVRMRDGIVELPGANRNAAIRNTVTNALYPWTRVGADSTFENMCL